MDSDFTHLTVCSQTRHTLTRRISGTPPVTHVKGHDDPPGMGVAQLGFEGVDIMADTPTPGQHVIGKRLFVLLACLFVVMIGFGITLPVLPFYVERLAQAEGATRQAIVMHVTLLTAVYSLGQLVFAPVWGRWSDRMGRRPLLLMGLAGYVIAQVLFGLATSLWLLYAARVLGGILSSATLPVSAASVADATTDVERGRGMAWLGTATSLGVVVGPALGLISTRGGSRRAGTALGAQNAANSLGQASGPLVGGALFI